MIYEDSRGIKFLISVNDFGEGYIEEISIPSGVNNVPVLTIPHMIDRTIIVSISRHVLNGFEGEIKHLIMPNTIANVESRAFCGKKIKKVSWGTNCLVIPMECFYNSELEEINGIENVIAIKDGAFSGTSLEKFNWPERCIVVHERVFSWCPYLKEITNTEEIQTICDDSFLGCINLKKIKLGSNVLSVKLSAFQEIPELKIDFSNAIRMSFDVFDGDISECPNIKIKYPYYAY